MTRYKLTLKYSPSQPRVPAGSPNGGQWAPLSGGGMIPRTAMPQILSKDLPHFFNYAREKGVAVSNENVRASSLKFRQAVDPAHAKGMPESALVKPILISRDNYVLDGNHRAAANAALGRKANVRRLDLPFQKAIDFMFTYPGVMNLEQAQEARKYDPNQPRVPAGSPGGGRWAANGSGQYEMGFSAVIDSESNLRAFLGAANVTSVAPSGLNNHNEREADPAGWIAYAALMGDREAHDEAYNQTPAVDLYQSTYYQNFNYALRYPDEAEEFDMLFYQYSDSDEYNDLYEVSAAAWNESGMADVTGKSYDVLYSPTEFVGSGELANDMGRALETYAPKLPGGINLYRTFRHKDLFENPEKYIGREFEELGFSSTTVNGYFAAQWGHGRRDRIIMRGKTDGSQRGLHLVGKNYGGEIDPYEFEVLLAPGTKYRIKSATRVANGDMVIDVDITTPGASAPATRTNKYDPSQPRAPAGSAIGGQWVSNGGFNASAGSAVFEVAPNPNDKELKARWEKLSAKEKVAASRNVLKKVVPEAAKELGISKHELIEHVGGWMGDVNPSYTMKALTGEQADAAARLLGYALKQEGMMLLSDKAFPGSFKGGMVGIDLKGGGPDTAAKIFKSLNELKKDDGDPVVIGFTMRGGRMEILHDSSYTGLSDRDFARTVSNKIDKAFDSSYDVYQTEVHASFLGEGDYLNAPKGRLAGQLEDWRGSAGRLRATAQKALEEELQRRRKETGQPRYRLTVRYNPNQPRDKIGRWTSGYHTGVQVGVRDILKGDGRYVYANLGNHQNPGELLGEVLTPVDTTADLEDALRKHSPGNTLVRIEGVEPGGTAVVTHVIERGKWGIRGDVVVYATSPELAQKRYNPGQPRVPAGSREGGRWTAGGIWSSPLTYSQNIGGVDYSRLDKLHEKFVALGHNHKRGEDVMALRDYQGTAYRDMNASLRYKEEFERAQELVRATGRDAYALEADGQLPRLWEEAGLTKATGKTYDEMRIAGTFNASAPFHLRGPRLAQELETYMKSAPPLGLEVTVYRAFRHEGIATNPQAYIGKEFVERGFGSTSLRQTMVEGWSGSKNRVIVRAKVPKEAKAMYLTRRDTDMPWEHEVLLAPGSKFKIKRITKGVDGTYVVDADVTQD